MPRSHSPFSGTARAARARVSCRCGCEVRSDGSLSHATGPACLTQLPSARWCSIIKPAAVAWSEWTHSRVVRTTDPGILLAQKISCEEIDHNHEHNHESSHLNLISSHLISSGHTIIWFARHASSHRISSHVISCGRLPLLGVAREEGPRASLLDRLDPLGIGQRERPEEAAPLPLVRVACERAGPGRYMAVTWLLHVPISGSRSHELMADRSQTTCRCCRARAASQAGRVGRAAPVAQRSGVETLWAGQRRCGQG